MRGYFWYGKTAQGVHTTKKGCFIYQRTSYFIFSLNHSLKYKMNADNFSVMATAHLCRHDLGPDVEEISSVAAVYLI